MTTTFFFDRTNQYKTMSMQRRAISIIQSFFDRSKSILGKPVFSVSPDKVIIQLFYYSPSLDSPAYKNNSIFKSSFLIPVFVFAKAKNKNKKNTDDFISDDNVNALGKSLTECWGRYVELRIVKLNNSGGLLDASILSQYLSKNYTYYSFARLFKIIKNRSILSLKNNSAHVLTGHTSLFEDKTKEDSNFNSMFLDSLKETDKFNKPYSKITGVEMKVSGRLTTQRSIPRKTIKYGRFGSSTGFFPSSVFLPFSPQRKQETKKDEMNREIKVPNNTHLYKDGPVSVAYTNNMNSIFATYSEGKKEKKPTRTDYSQHVSKNKLGAFTVKVWVSQNFD